jgi:hypothetical protein
MRKPRRGDLVVVTFTDLATDHSESDKATVVVGRTPGWYVGWRKIKGVKTLVVEVTQWDEQDFQPGWNTYPEPIVRNVAVIPDDVY